jgi:hypothetical protein
MIKASPVSNLSRTLRMSKPLIFIVFRTSSADTFQTWPHVNWKMQIEIPVFF